MRRPWQCLERVSRRSRSRGAILPLVAIGLPVIAGMLGMGIDMGRMFAAHAQLQAAVDSAALAGAAHLPDDPNIDNGQVYGVATEYLGLNYLGSSATEIGAGPDVRSVCVTAEAVVDFSFLRVMRINDGTVSATACAGFNDLEIVLVIDNTGSMSGSPINNTKEAAKELVELVMPADLPVSLAVGVVPFRGKVNIKKKYDGLKRGCRNADSTRNLEGPVGNCWDKDPDTGWWGAIPPALGLTRKKSKINAAIDTMTAPGGGTASSGTIISEGIRYGREVLTQAPPFVEGGDPKVMRKVMILLTDGDNEDGSCGGRFANDPRSNPSSTYRRNAYWGQDPPITNCTCENYGCLDQAMLTQAAQANDEDDIEIFVIRYGDSDWVDIDLMKQVASSKPGTEDHYFDAPNASDIPEIFKRIGRQLGYRLL